MRHSIRTVLAATLSFGLVAALAASPASAFDKVELKCRSTIAKGGSKFAKAATKAMIGCHKNRDKDGSLAMTNCNNLVAADTKSKLPTAESKFESSILGKCSGAPADLLYAGCPAPCDGEVPTVTTYQNVGDCLSCLTRSISQTWSDEANGTPSSPIADSADASCHAAITKNGNKLFNSVLKTVIKCQTSFEKQGSESINTCTNTGFTTLVNADVQKAAAAVQSACEGATLPGTLDPCGGEITAFGLGTCVASSARDRAKTLVTYLLSLPAPMVTTTTTTTSSTTTTTIPSHPECPNVGQLIVYSRDSNIACTDNTDCALPRTCDTGLGLCTTVTELDTGWVGLAHDSDVNDQVKTRAFLTCLGGPGAPCGECTVNAIDPSGGNCRCQNNVRNKCDQPFQADADDCGGAQCFCYFGAPFPLVSGGTPACIVNRFTDHVTGTANVDTGAGSITAKLRSRVHLATSVLKPCPTCGGRCSINTGSSCDFDEDCPMMGETCVYDTPNDGVRDGLCRGGFQNGLSCDVNGLNAHFPARPNASGGGGYSIDCQSNDTNVSGEGLKIVLTQSTGPSTMSPEIDCDGAGPGSDLCHCKVCTSERSEPCRNDGDCAGLPDLCLFQPAFGSPVLCTADSDCLGKNFGNCTANMNTACQFNTSIPCSVNSDCVNVDSGPCVASSCNAIGSGTDTYPDSCIGDCLDVGGGEGQCDGMGPDTTFCDAVFKANGRGVYTCNTNQDCEPDAIGFDGGACAHVEPRACFLPDIEVEGLAHPEFPVGAAVFCIPPTSNSGINSVAGLPGPGRVRNQAASATFCSTDNNVQYTPGVGGCPP